MEAKCKCGREFNIDTSRIPYTKSCGCRPLIDYTNKRINNFVVIKFIGSDKNGPLWECKCDCGTIFKVYSKNLPHRKSCG